MLTKPKRCKTEAEAKDKATEMAPDLFPRSACVVKDAKGKWFVATETQVLDMFADARSILFISNDGDVNLEDFAKHKEEKATRGTSKKRCKGCLKRVPRNELFAIPGRRGKFCMDCATATLEDK